MIETVILVDDEPLARINLRQVIDQFTDWKVVLELDSGEDIERYVQQLQPSVVFLDIKMPKRNGLSAAEGLLKLPKPPLLVFVSAYTEYALEAFEFYALDYLLKPFSDERFRQTVDRLTSISGDTQARKLIDQQQAAWGHEKKHLQVLIVRSIGVIRIVDLKDVIWIRGCGNYVEVMLDNEKILHRVSMNFLESNLNPQHFVRCHRSAMVRVCAVREIKTLDDGQMVIGLANGESTKLSQTYKDHLLAMVERQ